MTLMPEFWKHKRLQQMNPAEWEALCDGCGRCCLHKIYDEDGGDVHFTNVACRLLDPKTARCSDYPNRRKKVKDCQVLNPRKVYNLPWLPPTCAYRLLAEGRELPEWHPLVSGDRNSVRKAGISVAGKVVPEQQVKDLQEYIVDWLT